MDPDMALGVSTGQDLTKASGGITGYLHQAIPSLVLPLLWCTLFNVFSFLSVSASF